MPWAQEVPFGFRPHELLMQVLGAMQSELAVQVFLHAPFAQTKDPQLTALGVVQEPAPLHLDTPIDEDAVGQLAALQVLLLSQ